MRFVCTTQSLSINSRFMLHESCYRVNAVDWQLCVNATSNILFRTYGMYSILQFVFRQTSNFFSELIRYKESKQNVVFMIYDAIKLLLKGTLQINWAIRSWNMQKKMRLSGWLSEMLDREWDDQSSVVISWCFFLEDKENGQQLSRMKLYNNKNEKK